MRIEIFIILGKHMSRDKKSINLKIKTNKLMSIDFARRTKLLTLSKGLFLISFIIN